MKNIVAQFMHAFMVVASSQSKQIVLDVSVDLSEEQNIADNPKMNQHHLCKKNQL